MSDYKLNNIKIIYVTCSCDRYMPSVSITNCILQNYSKLLMLDFKCIEKMDNVPGLSNLGEGKIGLKKLKINLSYVYCCYRGRFKERSVSEGVIKNF
jgi:hypothetical protein